MYWDASDRQVGGEGFLGKEIRWDTVFKVSLSLEETGMGSTLRELSVIEEGLLANGEKLRGHHVQ